MKSIGVSVSVKYRPISSIGVSVSVKYWVSVSAKKNGIGTPLIKSYNLLNFFFHTKTTFLLLSTGTNFSFVSSICLVIFRNVAVSTLLY